MGDLSGSFTARNLPDLRLFCWLQVLEEMETQARENAEKDKEAAALKAQLPVSVYLSAVSSTVWGCTLWNDCPALCDE